MPDDPNLEDPPPLVDPGVLKPYASLMILRSTGQDHESAMSALCNHMIRASARARNGNTSVIVASGLGDVSGYLHLGERADEDGGLDDLWAFVYRRVRVPGWSVAESGYSDTEHELGVVIRRNRLIAVHCNASLRTTIQTWLDKSPRPPLERVAPPVLNGAFLRGEAKGLWLRGAQTPTSYRPDSKTVAGRRLQDTLSPFEDGGFALTAARASIENSPDRQVFTGTVGTSPRQSVVWNKPTGSFTEFILLVTEVLETIEETVATGGALERPYPVLAEESTDLSDVSGAFDIVVAGVDDLPISADLDPDVLDAIARLEEATLIAHGTASSPNFILEVGRQGAIGGKLRCDVVDDRNCFRFKIGYDPASAPTNSDVTTSVLQDLLLSADLLHVYYDSGHMFDGRSIWRRQVRGDPFPSWEFEDFSGYDITREKPCSGGAEAIHAKIGIDEDTSLFAWVVARYSEGWLTCDDGPGEVADFVHLAPNGDLSFIHVKAAESKGISRRPAVGPYEVVASQATKNLGYLDLDVLHRELASSYISAPASWVDGVRVPDRREFLEVLQYRGAREKKSIVIVQPHVSKNMYGKCQPRTGSPTNADEYRMMLLETLLNANRGSVTSLGAEFLVIGSLV